MKQDSSTSPDSIDVLLALPQGAKFRLRGRTYSLVPGGACTHYADGRMTIAAFRADGDGKATTITVRPKSSVQILNGEQR